MLAQSPRMRKDIIGVLVHPPVMDCNVEAIIQNEEGFASECSELHRSISDLKADWKERVTALKTLQALLMGGAGQLHNFREVMDKLKNDIVAQVGDLRSGVVKEACELLIIMSKTTPPHTWESMVHWFVPAVQRQLPVTVFTMANAANNCIRFMIQNNRWSVQAYRQIIEGTKYKSAKTRARSYEHLFHLAHHHSMAFLHSHNDHDLLWNAIASGVSDNDANTRQLTRLTYWGLQQTFPQKAEEFAHTLSIQHKKQVQGERATYIQLEQNLVSGEVTQQQQQQQQQQHHHHHQEPHQVTTRENRSGISIVLDKENTPPTARTPGKVRSHTPRKTPTHSTSTTRSSSRVLNDVTQKRTATPVRNHTPKRRHSSVQPEPEQSAPAASPFCPPAAEDHSGSDARQVDELLHATTKHHDWEIRANGYVDLSSLVDSMDFPVSKVLDACHQRLIGDPHFKVTVEILNCMQKTCEAHPREALHLLERILVAVFGCMSDRKGVVKDRARAVVDSIMAANTVGTMFQGLMKVLDVGTSKVRVSCLECVLYILQFCGDYLSTPKNMKQAIIKLLKIIIVPCDGDSREVEKMAVAALASLHPTHPKIFIAEAKSGLQLQQKRDLVKVLRDHIPDLSDDLLGSSNASFKQQKFSDPSVSEHQTQHQHHHQQQQQQQQINNQSTRSSPSRRTSDPNQQQAAPVRVWGAHDSSATKQMALKHLLQFRQRQTQWKSHFNELLQAVLCSVKDNDYQIRLLAVAVVQMAIDKMPNECLRSTLDIVFALLTAIDDQQSEVSAVAKEALFSLSKLPAPAVLLETLLQLFKSMSERSLQVVLVGLFPRVIIALPPEILLSHLPTLRHIIHTTISSDSTDLRKACTWCLVDLFLENRNAALHLCKGLPPAKIRLLDFYLAKRGAQTDLATELGM